MLLKCTSSADRKVLISSKGNGGALRGTGMRMTMATSSTMTPRIHRKGFRTPSKRHPGKVLPGKLHSVSKVGPGKIAPGKKIIPRPHPPPCDNSNDSGFGFDQHVEIQSNHHQQLLRTVSSSRSEPIDDISTDESDDYDKYNLKTKRKKIESIHIDTDDACSNDAFIQKISTTAVSTGNLPCTPPAKFLSTATRNNVRAASKRPTAVIQNNISTSSKDGTVHLEIVSQPEQQHRARYQTEGSRGAVKDRSGNGFPIVRLTGYNKPTAMQVFIGTDIGRVAPHMFYQACKVAGKNSTPCTERKVDGTMIIEIDFKPENDMIITCDCVGILKERNVDVEHRFPEQSGQRSKKKSTRCRMVFRTQLTHDDGSIETLQVCSYPIICTQPPGVPEICKKSLNSCPVEGGLELFIIGKNFLKDTCVIFRDAVEGSHNQGEMNQIAPVWEDSVFPDKEYLQQTHLVCTVPPYIHQTIVEPITVQLFVMSSGKKSESHSFVFTPKGVHSVLSASTTLSTLHSTLSRQQDARFTDNSTSQSCPSVVLWGSNVIEPKHEIDSDMMPPPTTTIPLGVRRSSTSGTLMPDQITQMAALKTEILDENSQNGSVGPETMQTDSMDQFSGSNENSVDRNSIEEMQFQRLRKQSIDLIDMRGMPILNESNSLPNFPTHENHGHMSVVDLAVKQDQIASQIQSQIMTAAQNQQAVNKFFPNLDSNMNDLKTSVDSNTVNSLFVNSSNTTSNSIFPQSQMNNMNVITSNQAGNMEQSFTQNVLPNNSPPGNLSQMNMNVITSNQSGGMEQSFTQNTLPNNQSPGNLTQMLSLPSNDSPNCVRSPSSNSSSSGIHSPITQDIILNSEPAASINSANMQIISQPTETTSSEHITSELILNTTVSPSMMCPPSSDPHNLIVNQVSMANTILNDINNLNSQSTQDNILNNMIISPPTDQMHVTNKNSPVNVNNMILKAAADFITNQERNISTESTINALMSLNSNNMLTDQQQSTVSQILSMPPSSQTTSSSSVLLQNNRQTMEICSTQQSLPQHMGHYNEPNVIAAANQILEQRDLSSENRNPMTNVPLGNLLLNEVSRTAQNEYLHNLQKANGMAAPSVTTAENQESLLQAVSLVRNDLEKQKIVGSVEQISMPQAATLSQQTATTQQTTVTAIPQEITTMSDQDLISYINPSAFDQDAKAQQITVTKKHLFVRVKNEALDNENEFPKTSRYD